MACRVVDRPVSVAPVPLQAPSAATAAAAAQWARRATRPGGDVFIAEWRRRNAKPECARPRPRLRTRPSTVLLGAPGEANGEARARAPAPACVRAAGALVNGAIAPAAAAAGLRPASWHGTRALVQIASRGVGLAAPAGGEVAHIELARGMRNWMAGRWRRWGICRALWTGTHTLLGVGYETVCHNSAKQ